MRAILFLITGLSLAALLNACSPSSTPAQGAAQSTPEPAASQASADIDARGVLEQFYAMHLRERTGGVPEETKMASYRPFLSKRLMGQLEQAAHERDQAITDHPDEKPPFVDGDLFSSLFEGATSFEVGVPVAQKDGRERVPVNFSHSEAGTPTERWTDVAVLVREDGGWKLDDLEYGGDWDFASKGRLSNTLDN